MSKNSLRPWFEAAARKRVLAALLLAGSLLGVAGCARSPAGKTGAKTAAAATSVAAREKTDARYPDRTPRSHVFDACALADETESQTPKESKDLWRNLQTLQKGALLGPALADFSRRANVFHCHASMEGGTVGEWHDNDGSVRISPALLSQREAPDHTAEDNILTVQAHELLHGIQQITDVGRYRLDWGIADRQMNLMAYEAAARTAQYLVGLELWDKDIQGPWKSVLVAHGPAEAACDAYDSAAKRKLPQAGVLAAAGAAGWNAQFRDRDWVDGYNNQVLKAFLEDLAGGKLIAPSNSNYSLATARKTGWVSDQLNFTAGLKALPAYAQRFAGNTRMRQAFDYAELQHISATLGQANPRYKNELRRLARDKNPFLGVDLAAVDKMLKDPKNTASPLEAMECFSGAVAGCTFEGKLLNPPGTSGALLSQGGNAAGPHKISLR